jgi:hypothetical protein
MSDTQPTQPLPDPAMSWVLALPEEPKRRRSPWPWIVALLIVVGLALGAWFGGEAIARDLISKTIRDQVVNRLALPVDQEVDVSIEGPVLPQLFGGTFHDVSVSSPDVTVGPVTGDVTVRAQDISIGDASARSATASVVLDQSQTQALLSTIEGFPASTVALAEPTMTISTDIQVLAVSFPVGASLAPSASDGSLVLTPTAVQLAGADISADDLRGRFGGLADAVLRSWDVCLAQYLPTAVTLTGAAVHGDRVVADFDVDPGILTDASLREKGTCA